MNTIVGGSFIGLMHKKLKFQVFLLPFSILLEHRKTITVV